MRAGVNPPIGSTEYWFRNAAGPALLIASFYGGFFVASGYPLGFLLLATAVIGDLAYFWRWVLR